MRSIGIERERFIICAGKIQPLIGHILPFLEAGTKDEGGFKRFGYELFAGQLEDRTMPRMTVEGALAQLEINDRIIASVCDARGISLLAADYVTEEELGELIVNPIDKRHKEIWEILTPERRVAASQVAAIHVHVGNLSADEIVRLLNYCRQDVIDILAEKGDFSDGKRLQAYRIMAEVNGEPPLFNNLAEILTYIKGKKGERNVWDMVRYKPVTKTVEFRMFGSTDDLNRISRMIEATLEVVHDVCKATAMA
ncbi:MAG: hypothetical protein NUV82_00795 [Candidatus Komeilibacteria bacterium]|nr:hypothetical protein [Candidatus Komeilibacteria bacterium]